MVDASAVSIPVEESDATRHPTLSLVDITKRFEGVAALTDVSLDVLAGEVHALLGENGAGKSTLMNIASGTLAPDLGTIVIGGDEIGELTPAVARELGIAMVHQHPAILPDMTVAENIRVAVGHEHLQRRDADITKAMRAVLDDVHFFGHLEDRVSSLSVARRHLLELAKAFAVSPRLLILDEPTAPLSQDSVVLLFDVVRKFAATGTAVVYITHRLGEVREIADRVTVLRDGTLRGTASVKDVSDAELLALIVGRRLDASFPPKHVASTEDTALLEVDGLSGPGFSDISLTLRRGEIVGIGGVVGNGQPAFLRALAGRRSSTGSVRIDGKAFSRRRLFEGAAYMPADRLTDGLMLDLNVRENAAITALGRLTTGPFISRRREIGVVQRELSELAVRAPSLEAPVSSLSGGNQQKVVLSKWLMTDPKVLILDEPTRGIDVGAKYEIYTIINELAEAGRGVVVISSEMPELLGICDRICVMNAGAFVGEFEGREATQEKIMRAIMRNEAIINQQDDRLMRVGGV